MKLSLTKVTNAVSEARQQLGLTSNPETRCFLLDMSYSMTAMDAGEVYGEKSRYHVLCDIVEQYPDENKVIFSTGPEIIPNHRSIREYYPRGSTNMGYSISFCVQQGYKHIILVTDGHPDSQDEVFQAIQNVERLDIIYAGPQPAPEFLRDLANRTSNVSYSDCSFKMPKQLTQKIAGLIGAAPKQTIKL